MKRIASPSPTTTRATRARLSPPRSTVSPDIGEVRKRKLLARFKSVKAIREAELPALQSELGRAVGRAVYDHFHPKD